MPPQTAEKPSHIMFVAVAMATQDAFVPIEVPEQKSLAICADTRLLKPWSVSQHLLTCGHLQ